MTRFLIIGASGLIGRHVLSKVEPRGAVGTYLSHPFANGHAFDIARDDIEQLLREVDGTFTHGLILGAATKIDDCARDPVGTAKVNVDGTIRTIDGLTKRGIVPIFASSDAVFDGSRGPWSETDLVAPITQYGRQKRAVESHVLSKKSPWLVLRICKVLDPGLNAAGILGPWITDCVQRTPIRCATDQRFSPIGIDDVVGICVKLAELRQTGIFHVGGRESVSRFELLTRMVAAIRRHADIDPIIEPCSIRDLPFVEPRPLDASVSIAKLIAATAYQPEGLDSICARAAAHYFRQ